MENMRILREPEVEEKGGIVETKDAPSGGNISLEGGFNPPDNTDIRVSLSEGIDQKPVDFSEFEKIITEKNPNVEKETKKAEEKPGEVKQVQQDKEKSQEVSKGDSTVREGQHGVDKEIKVEGKVELGKPLQLAKDAAATSQADDTTKYGEAAQFFPKMAKEAREYFKARLDRESNKETESTKKIAELETKLKERQDGTLPQNYLEHPEAYTLDPKYNQAMGNIRNVSWERNHWRQQLVAIRTGNKWQDLELGKDGKIYGVEKEPGPEADIEVQEKMQLADQILQREKNTIEQLKGGFSANRDNVVKNLQQMEDHYFPMYAGDKGKDNEFIKTMQSVLSERGIPEWNPLKNVVAKLYAFTMEQAQYIKEIEGKTSKVEQNKKIEAKINQPSSADINNVGGQKTSNDPNKQEFNLDDWNKLKE